MSRKQTTKWDCHTVEEQMPVALHEHSDDTPSGTCPEGEAGRTAFQKRPRPVCWGQRVEAARADEPTASASETRTRRQQAAGSRQEGSVLFTFRHMDFRVWPCLQGILKCLRCEHQTCTICTELLCDSADGRDEASASKIKSLKSAWERCVFKNSEYLASTTLYLGDTVTEDIILSVRRCCL